MKNIIFVLLNIIAILFFVSTPLFGQEPSDMMHSMGKMYVVVATICAVFVGIVIYLIVIDKKLTKLENQIKEKNG